MFDCHEFLSRLVTHELVTHEFRDKSLLSASIPTAEALTQQLTQSYDIVLIQQAEAHASLVSLGIAPSFLELAKQGSSGLFQSFRDWASSRFDKPLTDRQIPPTIVDALITIHTRNKWSLSPWSGAVVSTRDCLGPGWYLFGKRSRGFLVGQISAAPFLGHDTIWIIPAIKKVLLIESGYERQEIVSLCAHMIVELAKRIPSIDAYLRSRERKIVVCDRHCDFGHYVWNVLPAWNMLFELTQPDQVGAIACATPDSYFGSIKDIFGVRASSLVEMRVRDLDDLYDLVFNESCLLSSILACHITDSMATSVVNHSIECCDPEFKERLLSMRSRRWPVVLLSLRLDNPSWVDQVQGFAELARQLQQDFPDVGFVIHGMSKDGSRVWETTPRSLEAEISAASELECLLGDCEGVANAVGLSIHESVAIANLCDAFVAPLGSGMALYKWLTNKPGVVFSNQFCSDPANPQCWTRLVFEGFRDNPLPSTYVPLSAVTDVEAEHHGQRSQANFTLDRSVLHATIRNLLLSLTNLALRKPALQSSISRYSVGRTVADDARGGNNGSLSVDYGFHTATERDPWWQVDLKDLFLVQRVVIFNRLNQAERLKHFTLLGSPDGLDWTTLFRKTDGRVFGQAAEPFVAEVADGPPVRFVRVQLEGHEPLHFRECEVFGVHADARSRARMERVRSQLEKRRTYVPPGRRGAIVEISQFAVFVDENYDRGIIESLKRGDYRATECQSVIGFVKHCDRIIDLSASFGILSMTAARIAGAESLLAVHRDREAANDACDNFKRNGLEVIRSRVTILGDRRALNSPASCMNAFDSEPDIAKQGQVPVSCLEDLIDQQRATVLICDLEGGEIELLKQADLSRLRLILLKTCYSSAVDNLVGKLIASGLSLHLDRSHDGVLIMRRHEGVG